MKFLIRVSVTQPTAQTTACMLNLSNLADSQLMCKSTRQGWYHTPPKPSVRPHSWFHMLSSVLVLNFMVYCDHSILEELYLILHDAFVPVLQHCFTVFCDIINCAWHATALLCFLLHSVTAVVLCSIKSTRPKWLWWSWLLLQELHFLLDAGCLLPAQAPWKAKDQREQL